MKKYLISLAVLLYTSSLIAQAKIQFDTTVYDLGIIKEGTEVKKTIQFLNVGNESLIIEGVRTGDGGTFADYSPKDPIPPGGRGVITFFYNTTNRVMKFNKSLVVFSNSSYRPQCSITLKGEIVYLPTSVKVDKLNKSIGELKFEDVDTISFQIINTGKEKLHIGFNEYSYPECDLVSFKIEPKKKYTRTRFESLAYDPDDTLMISVVFKNVYGTTGKFIRKLNLIYNSHDTLRLEVTGTYTGMPLKQKYIQGTFKRGTIFYYENGRLTKREEYYNSYLNFEEFYEGSYCIHSKKYNWDKKEELSEEYFYKKGELINKKTYESKY